MGGIESSEGRGDGDIAPDAAIHGSAALLRAERAGGGDGRVYRISLRASTRWAFPAQDR